MDLNNLYICNGNHLEVNAQKMKFPLKISLVNVSKSGRTWGFVNIRGCSVKKLF